MKNPFRWISEEIGVWLAVLFMIWWIKPWRKPDDSAASCEDADYGYGVS